MRADTARKYFEVTSLLMDETEPAAQQVAAGVAVLAGVAASDAICGAALKLAPHGQSHDQAPELLKTVRPDGPELAKSLRRVLSEKTNAQYGTTYLSAATVRSILTNAEELVKALDRYVV